MKFILSFLQQEVLRISPFAGSPCSEQQCCIEVTLSALHRVDSRVARVAGEQSLHAQGFFSTGLFETFG